MPKYNTKSRLELAQLKRQLDTRRKQFKGIPEDTTPPSPPPPVEDTRDEDGIPSARTQKKHRFDYKFVFTNSAMKIEDKVFQVKNQAAALDRETRSIKPMAATTSFLPYGVTIRNPHMFEEDQLAVIQRRQEAHNISVPPITYNPFFGEDDAQTTSSSTALSPRKSFDPEKLPDGVPRIPNRYSVSRSLRTAEGRVSSLARKPLINYRSIMADGSTNTIGPKMGNFRAAATYKRDSEFREKFHALEAQRAKEAGNEEAEAYHLRRERSVMSNKAIDKLSSTVQQLNKYEERLKHYLQSKNTMVHAGAALKQLRFKRSKTIAQLSKLTTNVNQLQAQKQRSPRFISREENKKISFADDSSRKTRRNQNSPRNTPTHSRRPSPTPRDNKSGRSYRTAVDGVKLSNEIGNKILSLQPAQSPTPKKDDDKMTPLQAALIEGIELDKLSNVLNSNVPDKSRRKRDFVQPPSTQAPGPTPREAPQTTDTTKGKPEVSTISLFRHKQPPASRPQEPPSMYDGRDMLDVPKYTNAYERQARLFPDPGVPIRGQVNFENTRGSDVIRRTYQDFQIHQEKVQTELLRDRGRRTKRNLHTSNRGMAQLSELMQERAHTIHRPQRVPH